MIDGLVALAAPNRFHQSGYPRAWVRLAKRNAALLEKIEDELKVLKFFDGDGVEVFDMVIKVAVFLQVQRAGGGFAFEVRVIDENGREVAENFGKPVRRDFFAKQKHK